MKTKAQKALAGRAAVLRDIVCESMEATRFIHDPGVRLAAFEKVITILLERHFPSDEAARSAPVSRPSRRGGTK